MTLATRTSNSTPPPTRHQAERTTDTRLIVGALACCVLVFLAIGIGLAATATSLAGRVGLVAIALIGTVLGLAVAHALVDRRER